MDLTIAGNNNVFRDYRKGNWTLQETMVLIEAKKKDNERRMKNERGKPSELRWKWVEDYCWKNGCLRSQNQCNDKWDNLMRDFKKVRDYERRVEEGKSYWRIEKNERKDNHLPSSMVPHIFQALLEVVERRSQRVASETGAGSGTLNVNVHSNFLEMSNSQTGFQSISPPVQPVELNSPAVVQPSPPPVILPLPPPAPAPPSTHPFSQHLPSVDSSDTSGEYSDSPAKRRKRSGGGGGGNGEGTSGGALRLEEVGFAISKSATMIAEAIQSCEEREERRHREMLRLHERRLQIEESKAEINRQGINGLVDAVNRLATSILALASNKNQPPA